MGQGSGPLSAPGATTGSTAGGFPWSPAAIALGVGIAVFWVGIWAEAVIVRAVDGNRSELEWISDSVTSLGLAGIAYLWLHLRVSRLRVLRLEREQIAIDEQLRLAADIQRSLLPDVPEATPGFRWAAHMISAGRIGGDFYDFLRPASGIVLAIVADVSGKGIPASLILSSLKTLFRAIARDTLDPAAIAERISAALHEDHGGLPYATAIVARFETAPARLVYTNAGHPPGYLFRQGGVVATLESGGMPLGLFPGATYATASVGLLPGDLGLLVTDGVTEALETGPLKLGQGAGPWSARFSAGGSPAAVCEQLLQAAGEGAGPAGVPDWQDDRTAFVFAVEP